MDQTALFLPVNAVKLQKWRTKKIWLFTSPLNSLDQIVEALIFPRFKTFSLVMNSLGEQFEPLIAKWTTHSNVLHSNGYHDWGAPLTYVLGRPPAPVCTSRSQFSEEDSFHAAFFFFKPCLVAWLVVHVASQLDQMMDQQQRPGFPAQRVGCNRKFPASWQEWGPRIFLGA